MELLVVVGILVISLAIAIPAIGSVRRGMEMTRLDGYAKELYVGAQNELISREAAGQLPAFADALANGYSGQNLGKMNAKPSDYLLTDDSWKSYYYLDSTEATTAAGVDFMSHAVVSRTITDAGVYIVEFEPTSGDVYAVFYSEDPDFGYDDVRALKSRDQADRYRDANGYAVGYYCGGDASPVSIPDEFEPTATLVNDEELYLHIQCPTSPTMVALERYMTVNVTITDQYSATKTISLQGGRDFSLAADGSIDMDVLLDSMREGYSYGDITGLTPGLDFTATVSVDYSHGSKTVTTPQDKQPSVTGNSLFGSIQQADGTQVIEVSKVRHLNNLRDGYVAGGVFWHEVRQTADIDFDATTWDDASLSAVTKAYNVATYGSATGILNPIDPRTTSGAYGFLPLVLDNSNVFDGAGNLLENFYIRGAGDASWTSGSATYLTTNFGSGVHTTTATGLFGVRTGDTTDVTLVDPAVIGSTGTGALIGYAGSSGTVSGCGVYLTTVKPDGTAYTDDEMTARRAACAVTALDGSTQVGGLIGTNAGSAITKSFAAIDVHAASGSIGQVGGLVGAFTAGGRSLTDSYASGAVAGSTQVGGLVGYWTGGNGISYCYATSKVTADSHGGGLIGDATLWSSVIQCQSYGEVLDAQGDVDAATSGAFIGGTHYGVGFSNCSYLRQIGYNSGFTAQTTGITGTGYSALATGTLSTANSHPYAAALRGLTDGKVKSFPFAQIQSGDFTQTEHYGDWPERAGMNPTLVYYEKYTDGTFGYYAKTTLTGEGGDNDITIDTLRSDGSIVVDDGYALMTTYAIQGCGYSLNGGAGTYMPVSTTAGGDNLVPLDASNLSYEIGGETVKVDDALVYQLPFGLQETSRTTNSSFYDQLDLTLRDQTGKDSESYTYYYCSHFAKNAVNPAADGTAADIPDNPTSVYIRSARQLNALGRFPYYWNQTNHTGAKWSVTYYQENDIDFNLYAKNADGSRMYCGRSFNLMDTTTANPYYNQPIGHQSDNFRYTYDGQGYRIIDYRVSSGQEFVGLFGEVYTAIIRNVHMVASGTDTGSIVNTRSNTSGAGLTPAAGALVGLLYEAGDNDVSTIDNCSVSGYTVSFNPGGTGKGKIGYDCAVGGLVGYNMGTITRSSAVSAAVSIDANARANGTSACLGGLVGSNAGSIDRCYAGGTLAYRANTSNNSAYTYYGGLAGRYYYQWNQKSHSHMNASISDSYSFCRMDALGSSAKNISFAGVADKGGTGTTGKTLNSYTITDCYYLTGLGTATLAPNGSTPCTYTEMTGTLFTQLAGAGFGAAAVTYDDGGAGSFPYPAIVTDATGRLAHYGTWSKPSGA